MNPELDKLKLMVERVESNPALSNDSLFSQQVIQQIQTIQDLTDLDMLATELCREERLAGQYLLRALRSVIALNEDVANDQAWLLTAFPIETSGTLSQTGILLKNVIYDVLHQFGPAQLEPRVFDRPCLLSEVSSVVSAAELMFGAQLYTMVGKATDNICVWPIMWQGRIADVERFNDAMHDPRISDIRFKSVKQQIEEFAEFCGLKFKVYPVAAWENAFSICRAIQLKASMSQHVLEIKNGAHVDVDHDLVVMTEGYKRIVLGTFPEETPSDIANIVKSVSQSLKANAKSTANA